MNYSYLFGFLVCLILITQGAFAYAYYYPIEPDNKLLIYGETETISCSQDACNYNFSITNNDLVEHTINISSYLTGGVKKPIAIKPVTYKTNEIKYTYCTEYLVDKNVSTCVKTEERTRTETISTFENELGAIKVMPEPEKGILSTRNSIKTSNKTSLIQTNQDTINGGETKYYTIIFNPIIPKGELIIMVKSDSQPTIKASLDPTYTSYYTDTFEDNELNTNPYWYRNPSTRKYLIQSGTVKNGVLALDTNGTLSTIAIEPSDDLNFSTWIRMTDVSAGNRGDMRLFLNDTNANNKSIHIQLNDSAIKYDVCDGAETTIVAGAINTWYNLMINFRNDTNKANFIVKNSSGTIIGTALNVAVTCGQSIPAKNLFITGTPSADKNVFFDDVVYGGDLANLSLNFTYAINKTDANIQFLDATTTTETINDWNWLVNGTKVSDDQNFTKTGITELTDYNVCLQVATDTNSGQLCKIVSSLDWTAPITTFSYTIPTDSNIATITLTCTDNNSGCLITKYKIDGGSWQTYTTDFNFEGTGYHYIDYNSTDNNANIETTKRSDLNMPLLLIIHHPKDEDTLLTIDGNWTLDVTGTTFIAYSNLLGDKNIYISQSTAVTLKIGDMNSLAYFSRTYYKDYNGVATTDILQPYLVPYVSGLGTTIKTVSSYTNQPVPNVQIKIYKMISGTGRTYVEELLTDSKGEALSLLVTGDEYEFEIYFNGIFIRTDSITATSTTIYIPITDFVYNKPVLGNINASIIFLPSYAALSNSDKKLVQTIYVNDSNSDVNIQRIYIKVLNTDINGIKNNNAYLYSTFVVYADENTTTNTIDINGLAKTINGVLYDTNGFLKVEVTIQTSDVNYSAFFNYKPSLNINPIYAIGFGSRNLFGCDSYYDSYGNPNPLIPCPTQLFIALFISFMLVAGLAWQAQFTNPAGLGLVFLLIIGIFTYLTFVPIILYGLMFAGFVVVMIVARGRFN